MVRTGGAPGTVWREARSSSPTERNYLVIILGALLLILGAVLDISILWTIGIILVVVGIILAVLGMMGRAVGGRNHWF
jgi:hypothetical protein